MALLWMQSFDQFGDDETQLLDGVFAQAQNLTLFGTGAPAGTTWYVGVTDTLRRVFGAAKTLVGFGLRLQVSQLPNFSDRAAIMSFRDAANAFQLTVALTSTGALAVKRGNVNGTQIGISADGVIVATTWIHIEAKVRFDQSSGSVELRVNGVTVLNLAGQDTCATANVEASQVAFGHPNSVSGATLYCTDWVAWDDDASNPANPIVDFVGDKQVFWRPAASDTADADWIKSTGSVGYVLIDEAPANTSDYIQANNVGDRSDFGVAALPASVVLISAIEVVAKAIKTDAGVGNMQLAAVSSGISGLGVDRPMTTSWAYYSDVVALNPDTDAPWTVGEVDAMNISLRRTA